ncbi:hypothetical protein HNQ93_000757 [Hymenobacter luteus]|uniref:Guanylate cyclase domain-containing protein n=2 Tax=Hymenobacter TaxID=89966 RepID=A0A7W9SXV6_9BACT|nr:MULTISPECIES: DUF2652 domain-containing protein [Hymenobacter]MBB4599763.1 hypothetical protein [Hymenobacter latericoloratus]MBB6057927.1 hypothetical protein [Hymenobacter luteus]
MGLLDDLRADRRVAGTAPHTGPDKQVPALLLIPDISGFTRFIEESGSPQAPFLVADLLEILIEANTLDLQVNEIQGDAVLFYRLGPPPPVAELVRQCRRIYLDFQNYLRLVARDTGSELAAALHELALTLKIVVHYGRVSVARIREYTKLMGRDVIVVHRLLKNNVTGSEYVLLSAGYVATQPPTALAQAFSWTRLLPGATYYEYLGETPYHYASLSPLRLLLSTPEIDDDVPPGRGCALKVRRALRIPAPYALRIITNFRLRPRWMEGATAVHYDVTKVGRLGTSYKVDVFGGQIDFQAVQQFEDEDGRLEYVEKISHFRLFPNTLLFYSIEAVTAHACLVTMELRYGHIASASRVVRFGQLRRLHRFLGRSIRGLAQLLGEVREVTGEGDR